MQPSIYSLCIAVIALIALGRALVVYYVFVRRSLAYRKLAVSLPSSWSDFIAYPEPALLFAVTLSLWITHEPAAEPATLDATRVALGVFVALSAFALHLWSVHAFPKVGVGHYVLPEQQIVTKGPYAYIRHPIYACVIMIWVSVAIGFASWPAALITIAYVIPAYFVYSRSEEKMMVEHFGDAYRAYRKNTGAFLPRLRKRPHAPSTR